MTKDCLALRDNAKAELMQIKSIEEGVTYLNKLESVAIWVMKEKKDAELSNMVAEQKLRTQRILGELLQDADKVNGARGVGKKVELPDSTPLLQDYGVSKRQSSTFQQIAEIPEEVFEDFIKEKKEAVNNAVAELTTTGAVRLAQSIRDNKGEKINKTNYDRLTSDQFDSEVKELLERINALPLIYRIKIKQAIRRGK